MRLNELFSARRTAADYAFYNGRDPYASETLGEACRCCDEEASKQLARLHEGFKLAESLQTARLLIGRVEEQRTQQGERIKSRAR